jgi:Transposase domain (DUF772)
MDTGALIKGLFPKQKNTSVHGIHIPPENPVSWIASYVGALGAKDGRPQFAVETMLRIHFLQQCVNLSEPAMEEALYDMVLFREVVGLDAHEDNLPDKSTSCAFVTRSKPTTRASCDVSIGCSPDGIWETGVTTLQHSQKKPAG